MTGKARSRRLSDLGAATARAETLGVSVSDDESATTSGTSITKYGAGEPMAYSDAFSRTLMSYPSPVTTLRVEVLRSHETHFKGTIMEVPNNDHTAGMIQAGFYMIIPPEVILGVDWS